VVEWLALLDIDSPVALPILCGLVEKTVTPDRLDLGQCVDLACARPAPVARLGLGWAQSKKVDTPEALQTLLRLAGAQAPSVREEAVRWVLGLIAKPKLGTSEHLLDMLDARYADVRRAAVETMEEHDRFSDDTKLWAALAESPYADARGFLVKHLSDRLGGLSPQGVHHVWATTLLAVSRGSRAKRTVLRQLADRIASQPTPQEDLVSLLAIALRSVREPERRAALAAVSRASFVNPALRASVQRHVPELVMFPEELS
jgi:HEAT repeat protein